MKSRLRIEAPLPRDTRNPLLGHTSGGEGYGSISSALAPRLLGRLLTLAPATSAERRAPGHRSGGAALVPARTKRRIEDPSVSPAARMPGRSRRAPCDS